ncbi:MAG: hypothetical protein Q9201_005624 [Fulgogasparrea decipioides]
MTEDQGAADDNTGGVYDQVLQDITQYVYDYEIESSRAWICAKRALLDALGCALETLAESEEVRALIGPINPGTSVPDGFRLPGTPYHLDPLKGAFDLGSLIRYLDHNDAYPGAEWGHPSDNIGAILPIADWLSRRSRMSADQEQQHPPLRMTHVLQGIIKAYEIQGCFQIRNAFNAIGLDHTILVKIASTAVSSWLFGLTQTQAMDALSQAWMDGHPLRVFRQSPNTGPRKGWAAGDACMRAVHLSLLTRNGQPGAPSVLTVPRWGFYATYFGGKREFELPRPFGTWVIESVFFKIHAVEGHGASAAEAALELTGKLRGMGLRSPESDIARIHVRTQQAAMIIINKQGPLHNAADRDHCMQYIIAVILLKGSMIESTDYQDTSPWVTDRRVDELRKKIDLVEEPRFTADYHDKKKRSASSGLTVTLKDGTQLDEVLCEYPVGHPWREDTTSSVQEKFKANVEKWFGKGEKAQNILDMERMDVVEFGKMQVYDFVDRFAGE